MSDGGLSLDQIPDRTPEQAREELARKDRAGWHAAGRLFEPGQPRFLIMAMDRRTVGAFDKEPDRDHALRASRSHDKVVAALEAALIFANAEIDRRGSTDAGYETEEQAAPLVKQIGEALALANRGKS